MEKIQDYKADLFKALSNPLRIEIIEMLRDRELVVNEIADTMNCEHSHISQQLSVLRSNGIVKSRKEGNYVFYSIADDSVLNVLEKATLFSRNRLENLRSFLGKLSDSEAEVKRSYNL